VGDGTAFMVGLRTNHLWRVSTSIGARAVELLEQSRLDTSIAHSAAPGERAASNTSYNNLLHILFSDEYRCPNSYLAPPL
jgi:hypothetical protein